MSGSHMSEVYLQESGTDKTKAGRPQGEQEAIRKAMNLLLYRSRSERELRDRLLQAEFSEEATETAIAYVKSFGYVNDARFAEQYCISESGRKSRACLRMELQKKGIADDLISCALDALETDESELVAALLEKRYGQPHRMDEAEQRKAYGYLGRRGFSASVIRTALRTYQA